MRTRFRVCMISAVFALLVVGCLSQSQATRVVYLDKREVIDIEIEPQIDFGEDGDDPGRIGAFGVSGQVVGGDAQEVLETGAVQGNNSKRIAILQEFLYVWLRQLFQ